MNKKIKRVDKYLTDIKELPPYKDEESVKETGALKKEEEKKIRPSDASQDINKKEINDINTDNQKNDKAFKDVNVFDSDNQEIKKGYPFSSRDIILGVINIISLALLIVILVKFPKKAKELQSLRAEKLQNESNLSFEFIEVEDYKKIKEELKSLFIDESGIVDFVSEIDKLKLKYGFIKKISFTSQEVIKDRTGNYGTPVILEVIGSWEQIDKTIQDIDSLHFIFRPVSINVDTTDEEGVVALKYGGFLYVDDRLGKN